MGLVFGGLRTLVQSTASVLASLVGQDLVVSSLKTTGPVVGSTGNTWLGARASNYTALWFNVTPAATNYAIGGGPNGDTDINATTGQAIGFNINNSSKANMTASAWTVSIPFAMADEIRLTSFTDDSATPGNRTVNKVRGVNAIAIGAATCVITNSFVSATSLVIPVLQFGDATATTVLRCIPAAGSFTLTVNAAATAATKFGWVVIN